MGWDTETAVKVERMDDGGSHYRLPSRHIDQMAGECFLPSRQGRRNEESSGREKEGLHQHFTGEKQQGAERLTQRRHERTDVCECRKVLYGGDDFFTGGRGGRRGVLVSQQEKLLSRPCAQLTEQSDRVCQG